VRLQTTIPLGDAFLGSLTHPWASILNRRAVEEAGQDYGQKPVGTGRFTLKRLIPGDRVELERFDGYHGDKARLRNIIFRTYLEATTRAIELESGALDVAIDISPVDVNRIRDNPKLEIVTAPSWRNYHIGFDTARAPFDNPLVRQAINLAINREGIVKAVYRGFAQASRGAFPSTVAYSSYENAPELAYDPKKAKELLAQAGFPDGFKSGFIVPERSDFQNIATVLQNNLREIGIEFNVRVTEYGAITELIRQKGHDPYLNNLGNAPTSNPVFSIDPLVHSRFLGKSNYFSYSNPELDRILDTAVASDNEAEKSGLYKEAWDILLQDLPIVNILVPLNIWGKVKNLKGVPFAPAIITNYGRAYFE
jgi:peptide/nickel transport system substrate-binding protein